MNKKVALGSYVLLVFIASVYLSDQRLAFCQEYGPATLLKLMEGTALLPFQLRFLSPQLIRVVYELTSADLSTIVRYYEIVMLALTVFSIRAYALASGLDETLAMCCGFALIFLYPFLYIYQPLSRLYYPYDSMSVLFWSFGLFCIISLRPYLFMLVLAVGLLNRESIFLLFPFAYVHFRKSLGGNAVRVYLFLGCAVIVATKVVALALYGGNPGAGVLSLDHDIMRRGLPVSLASSRIYTNILQFFSFDLAVGVGSILGYLWVPLLVPGRHIENTFVRNSLWLLPLSFAIMLFVANIYETRVFAELSPIVIVALAHLVNQRERAVFEKQVVS